MIQTFRIQRARGEKLFNRKDLAKMLRHMADELDKHADFFYEDPSYYASETNAYPSRFEISGTIRKNDTFDPIITIQDFQL